MSQKKSGPAFNRINNSQLMAVMRRDAAKAADYASRHQVPLWYSDADDLLDNIDLNAIYVATPPSSHLAYAYLPCVEGNLFMLKSPLR
jgi:predicted dehydrogenase